MRISGAADKVRVLLDGHIHVNFDGWLWKDVLCDWGRDVPASFALLFRCRWVPCGIFWSPGNVFQNLSGARRWRKRKRPSGNRLYEKLFQERIIFMYAAPVSAKSLRKVYRHYKGI